MTYDKTSFLAGVAVGRQLKGWGGPAGRREKLAAALGRLSVRVLSAAVAVPPGLGGRIAVTFSIEEEP